ncbi:AAA family ATPase [Vibrio chagasii]|uniref:DNA 3'-5' helicase n=1 Tax=Vibrio chagasii TaxID=170679 RepID=A0A7V7NX49_9VIBR|nr:UvrD-helicase domain-containing protein [Vibrio chagasii]KAB0482393.1 AAA family ATPase [Vibrio chagasii]
MKPTNQQNAITCRPVAKAVIKALAGTGKTSVLRMLANRYSELRFLYIAYNRPIVDEANMPPNCLSLTGHQLAYKFVGKYYSHKLSDNLNMGLIKNKLGLSWADANSTKITLENFFFSQDKEIEKKHAPGSTRNSQALLMRAKYVSLANQVWKSMKDLDGEFPMTHDGYLKGFSIAEVDLSSHFDILLIDEAQDLNPAVKSFIAAQKHMKTYYCGDDSQQLYRYRGAEDSLADAEKNGAEVFWLTQSFRFNDLVAKYANSFLSQLKVPEKLKGTPNGVENSIVDSIDKLDQSLPVAFINRTILRTIEVAIEAEQQGKKVMWIGGIEKYPFSELFDVLYLKLNQRSNIKSRDLLKSFKSFESYQEVAKQTNSLDMARVLRLIKKYGEGIFTIYQRLKKSEVVDRSIAEVIVGTCHRTKGLEFPQVVLGSDFGDSKTLLLKSEEEIRDELNLMYTAITRTQIRLVTCDKFESIVQLSQNILDLKNTRKAASQNRRGGRCRKRQRGYTRKAA